MANNFEIETSPGQQLQILLKRMYPQDTSNSSFISSIDDALYAGGELAETIYDSTINYMTRRLITTARYLKGKNEQEGTSERAFIYSLRKFLKHEIKIPSDKIEIILVLLLECVRASSRGPTRRTIEHIRQGGGDCYICGVSLNMKEDKHYNSATVEHIWPNSIGGGSNTNNLKLCCLHCNNIKASYLDASDYHYEEICLISDKGDDEFSIEMRRAYELALWTKSGYSCTKCSQPAKYVGKLEFSRRNINDSWHFFNIDAYCSEHVRE